MSKEEWESKLAKLKVVGKAELKRQDELKNHIAECEHWETYREGIEDDYGSWTRSYYVTCKICGKRIEYIASKNY